VGKGCIAVETVRLGGIQRFHLMNMATMTGSTKMDAAAMINLE
jgi:hypothetical protein